MERPKNINDKKTAQAVRLILIFHLVGLAGLSIPVTRSLFLILVPFHLLLMTAILGTNHKKFDTKFILFFLVMFITGYIAEWVGVHTGLLFGDYVYDGTLGFKIDGIPLIMGANWFLLIYAVGTTLQQVPIKQMWLRVLIGSAALVLLDLLIEPAAIKFNYWHWLNTTVPIANYVCWFVLGALLLSVFELCRFKKQSIIGMILLISQFLFFLALLPDSPL
jgi:putative membrane protein